MSKKHITAPLSYDPGKGRPKEYLAYLNWQEMQALQRLNGGNMERGPRGLPSFPPDDAIGSNQTPGSGNWTGSPGGTSVGSGPGGDVGGTTESGNIGGAGTSTSTTSSAASSAASTTSAASQNTTDEAAQQAAAVNNAVEAAKNAALNEDARRAGIGSIDIGPQRTPVNIGGGAISAAVQSGIQQAYSSAIPAAGPAPSGFMSPEQQMIDRQNTMYSPKALSDLYKGIGTFGISDPSVRTKIQQSLLGQTIELSKAGKTLGYESAPYVGSTGTLDPTKSGVVTHWTGSVNTKIPTLGLGNEGNGYGIVVDENGNVSYTKKFDEQGRYPQTWHTKGYNQNRIGIANIGINPNQAQIQSVGALGREWFNPEATATSHGYVAGDLAKERRARGEEFSGRPSAEGKALASAFSEGLESPSISINPQFAGISPTSVPSFTVVPASVELAGVEESYNPGVIADPAAMATLGALTKLPSILGDIRLPAIPEASQAQKTAIAAARMMLPESAFQGMVNKAVADAVQQSGFNLADTISSGISALNKYAPSATAVASKPYQERLMTVDGVTREVSPQQVAGLSPEDQRRLDDELQRQVYTPAGEDQIATVEEEYRDPFAKPGTTTQNYKLFDEAQVYPRYVTPERQALIADQERKNRIGIKVIERAPFVGPVTGAVEGITKLFTGEDIADQATQKKYAFEQMSPEQQAAAMAKDPSLRRYAVSAGIIPPSGGNQYAYSGGTPTRELGGKDNQSTLYLYGAPDYPNRYTSYQEEGKRDGSGLRKQYRLWDMGIGIPEPGDPDYNDYMKYLKSRGTSVQV